MASRNYVNIANKYIKDVLSEKQPACSYVKKACERQQDDLKRKAFKYKFDKDRASRICKFIEQLPHIKGILRGKPIKLEPWQIFILTTVFGWVDKNGLRRFKTAYTEVPRKNGKALALDTPIPTPDGWVTMGDLQIGDRVFNEKGEACNVVNTSEVFTDHECYRINFSNGESVVADAGHLWLTTARVNEPEKKKGRTLRRFRPPSLTVHTHPNGKSYYVAKLYGRLKHIAACNAVTEAEAERRFNVLAEQDLKEKPMFEDVLTRVRTTEEIYKTQYYGARNDNNHSLSMPDALILPELDLPVHPYVLGAWLGDGSSGSAVLTCGSQDKDFFVKEISRCGFDVIENKRKTAWSLTIRTKENGEAVSKNNPKNLQKQLRGVGVLHNKHIPEIYLRASYSQRLALLQGLMDTDGTVNKNGRILSFTTIRRDLANGMSELLASLGIKHSIRECPMTCNGVKLGRNSFQVQFNTFLDHIPAFRMGRKLDRMNLSTDIKTANRSRSIQVTSVEKVNAVPTKCIQVDSPSKLFLFGKTMLPTHNSSLSSGVALYLLCCDQEGGPEVYSAATTRDQARIVWDDAKRMVDRCPELREYFGVQTSAHAVFVPNNAGVLKALARDQGGNLDGLNIHGAIVDELHAHKTREVWDVLETATGARTQPLIWGITTAGFNRTGICYEQRAYSIKILDRVHIDEEYFGIIYTIDEGMDWTDPATWSCANPNWGVSVSPEDIARKARKAMEMAAATNNFLTKHLNIWVNADTSWMNMRLWDACADPNLKPEDFAGERCWIGIDLATKKDLAVYMKLFVKEGKYYLFGKYYLPEDAAEEGNSSHYQGWERQGILTLTPGASTDFEYIENDLKEDAAMFDIQNVGYDSWQANYFAKRLMNEGLPMIEYGQQVKNMSEPMKQLEVLVLDQKLQHNGCPILTWAISNVVAHLDAKENIYPRKEFPENKIDPAVASIMALGLYMNEEDVNSPFIFTL